MSDEPEQNQPVPEQPEQSEQSALPDEAAGDAADDQSERAFLDAVRRAAGWRVSPRQVAAAIEAIETVGDEPTPERVARVVAAGRGERSQRQRRHADLWRLLGAQLAVHGQPSDPEAQRDFVGRARAVAGEGSDALVMRVALAVAANQGPMNPRSVGEITRWLLTHEGETLSDEVIAARVPEAIEALERDRAEPSRRRDRAPRSTGRPGGRPAPRRPPKRPGRTRRH